MNILVTFAVDPEFAPWRKLRDFKKRMVRNNTGLHLSSFLARIGDKEIEVILTGIGRNACEQTIVRRDLAQSPKPDLVISSGLAGALHEDLKPGDLIAPRTVRTLKNDANADANEPLRTHLIGAGVSPIDTMITVDRVVQAASEKSRLAFLGEAVDMESAIIMSYCAKAGIPVVTIRAISDAADEDLPIDFDRCLTPEGAVKPLSLVNAIVRRPGNLSNLVRFGRQSNMAAQRLALFLDDFVASIPACQERNVVA